MGIGDDIDDVGYTRQGIHTSKDGDIVRTDNSRLESDEALSLDDQGKPSEGAKRAELRYAQGEMVWSLQ